MKKIILFMSIAAFFMACDNSSKSTEDELVMSVDSFLLVAENHVGEELDVKGIVANVCEKDGMNMKMSSSSSSESISVVPSEAFGSFDVKFIGTDVIVTGTVVEKKIDMAYITEWEAEIAKAKVEAEELVKAAIDTTDLETEATEATEVTEVTEVTEATVTDLEGDSHLEKIAEYKKEIEASENGFVLTYSLEVNKMVLDTASCEPKVTPEASEE